MFSNDEIVKRAENIAAQKGGHWFRWLNTAREELATEAVSLRKQLKARNPASDDAELIKAAAAAGMRRLAGAPLPLTEADMNQQRAGRQALACP